MRTPTASSLPLETDLAFQRKFWSVERVGWGIASLLVAGSLAGLAGRGWLSERSEKRDGLQVRYERFARADSPTRMAVRPAMAGKEGPLILHLQGDLPSSLQVSQVIPDPVSVTLTSDGLAYEFSARQLSDSAEILFYAQPQKVGGTTGSIRQDGTTVQIRQFVYP